MIKSILRFCRWFVNGINKGIKEKKELEILKKKLIDDFLEEHGQYIPKYSPRGLLLDWNIFVYKEGEYDLFTGKFKGEYKVGIEQKPPKFLHIDGIHYMYNVKTKQLEEHGIWQ